MRRGSDSHFAYLRRRGTAFAIGSCRPRDRTRSEQRRASLSLGTAYSVLEALRIGAAHVLDMHKEDLQILVIGYIDREKVDALLWDPMPGGSGLLDRLCERFNEIVQVASDVVSDCPALCGASCIDCLQSFRNAYYHRFLDREIAANELDDENEIWVVSHPPHTIPSSPLGFSRPLRHRLVAQAGH